LGNESLEFGHWKYHGNRSRILAKKPLDEEKLPPAIGLIGFCR